MRNFEEHLNLGFWCEDRHNTQTFVSTGLRLESLRPLESWLSSDDYWILERQLLAYTRVEAQQSLLARLIRTKLADARIVGFDSDPPLFAKPGTKIAYTVDRQEPEARVLVLGEADSAAHHALPVFTLLGLTLLGMREGQSAPLLRHDGVVGSVSLQRVGDAADAADPATSDWQRRDRVSARTPVRGSA